MTTSWSKNRWMLSVVVSDCSRIHLFDKLTSDPAIGFQSYTITCRFSSAQESQEEEEESGDSDSDSSEAESDVTQEPSGSPSHLSGPIWQLYCSNHAGKPSPILQGCGAGKFWTGPALGKYSSSDSGSGSDLVSGRLRLQLRRKWSSPAGSDSGSNTAPKF